MSEPTRIGNSVWLQMVKFKAAKEVRDAGQSRKDNGSEEEATPQLDDEMFPPVTYTDEDLEDMAKADNELKELNVNMDQIEWDF